MILLTDSILKHVPLTADDITRIPAYFESVKTRRHQYLLREGDICRYEFFVLKGCCRQYEVDTAGKENVLQFSVEGWWMTDLDSLLHEKPSLFNIDVLESGEILQINKQQLYQLFQDIPAVAQYYHIISQRSSAALQRRILFLAEACHGKIPGVCESLSFSGNAFAAAPDSCLFGNYEGVAEPLTA